MRLVRSGEGVRSGFLETPRTRLRWRFSRLGADRLPGRPSGALMPRVRHRSEVVDVDRVQLVVRAGLLRRVIHGTAAFGGVTVAPMPAGRGLARLADVADRERRDGGPELVVGCKDAVIPMPVLPRRWNEIGEPVEELKRREFDNAIGSRPLGLPPTTPPDPVGRPNSDPAPREHVADLGDAAGWAADHEQSLQCKGRPGTGAQQVLEALKVARHVTVYERHPDTGVDGKPAVLPGEHIGGGRGGDGIKQDVEARLYVAGGNTKPQLPFEADTSRPGGIYVFDPNDGRLLQFLPVPTDEVTNCAFGGPDRRDLYITAGGTLYTVRTTTPGRVWWPKTP